MGINEGTGMLIQEEDVGKKREVQPFLHFQKYSLPHIPPTDPD